MTHFVQHGRPKGLTAQQKIAHREQLSKKVESRTKRRSTRKDRIPVEVLRSYWPI